MSLIDTNIKDNTMTIYLKGHVDSGNSAEVEKEVREAVAPGGFEHVIIDMDELEYISSAGLRIILRLRKDYPDLKIVNVSKDVFEVLEMTGFTEMIEVQKAYRRISVEGCEVIGQGANGKVYRIDPDTIVKVYNDSNALPDIQRERELARKAFVLGIPTAIPYDVVRVDDHYGSVFELLNATSFAKLIIADPDKVDEVMTMSVDLLKKIHDTVISPEDMPSMKEVALGWADYLDDHLPEDQAAKLRKLIEEVPEDNHLLHGDYHVKNVMLQDGEVLLIDMDTLCHGHPVFEFAAIYSAYKGFAETDHDNTKEFLGIDYDTCGKMYDMTLHKYFSDKSEEEIQEISRKASILSYARILRRALRSRDRDSEEKQKTIANCREHLAELLPQVDTLLWD